MTATAEPTREARDLRLDIARDLLARLDAGTLVLAKGSYLQIRDDLEFGRRDPDNELVQFYRDHRDADLGPHVDAIAARCHVCLLGGLLLAKAHCHDRVPLATVVDDDGYLCLPRPAFVAALAEAFDPTTLWRLETFFEGVEVSPGAEDVPAMARRGILRYARSFGYYAPEYDEDGPADNRAIARARARAAAENLIAHDGEFVVPAEFLTEAIDA